MTSVSVFAVFVILSSVPVCYPIRITRRIIGGKCANAGDSPFQVSLQYIATWKHLCGGSIIDDSHVITAAHCIYTLSVLEVGVAAGLVRLSDPSQRRYILDSMYIHGEFRPSSMKHDIAIVKINGKFKFKESKLEYIALSSIPVSQGIPVRAFGWGVSKLTYGTPIVVPCISAADKSYFQLTYIVTHSLQDPERFPDNLQVIDLITLNFGECAFQYKNNTHTSLKLSKGMLCAGVTSGVHFACFGDGGGALINQERQLVGIASWETTGCGTPNLPGIYTDVYGHTNWLHKTLIGSRNSSTSTFGGLSVTHQCLLLLYFYIHGTR